MSEAKAPAVQYDNVYSLIENSVKVRIGLGDPLLSPIECETHGSHSPFPAARGLARGSQGPVR